jgi:hypothetical protein
MGAPPPLLDVLADPVELDVELLDELPHAESATIAAQAARPDALLRRMMEITFRMMRTGMTSSRAGCLPRPLLRTPQPSKR